MPVRARGVAWPSLAAAVAVPLHAAGQGPPPAFEVASIRRNASAPFGFPGLLLQPGGRATSPGTSVRQMILVAYGLPWLASDFYAVDARAGEGATRASVRLMLRSLLQERFQLVAHTEPREFPAYALVMSTRDGRFGERLRRPGPECAPVTPPPGVPLPPPPPPPPSSGAGGQVILLPTEPLGPTCGYVSFPGWISGRRITMEHFVLALTALLRRPVVNETALTGDFDLDVTFAPDQSTVGDLPAANAAAPADGGRARDRSHRAAE